MCTTHHFSTKQVAAQEGAYVARLLNRGYDLSLPVPTFPIDKGVFLIGGLIVGLWMLAFPLPGPSTSVQYLTAHHRHRPKTKHQ